MKLLQESPGRTPFGTRPARVTVIITAVVPGLSYKSLTNDLDDADYHTKKEREIKSKYG